MEATIWHVICMLIGLGLGVFVGMLFGVTLGDHL
jgi:hypothetical protein